MVKVHVVNPGLYSTIQDIGRTEFQQFGVPAAGSMDEYAHRISNLLVGNTEDAPVIELTALGGTYEFSERTIISITGGDMSPMRNGKEPLKMWRTLVMDAGDRLSFGAVTKGFRTYLSIVGGFDIPSVLKSRSTYTRAGLGGVEGRTLKKGDVLKSNATKVDALELLGRFVRVQMIPEYKNNVTLRVILGPQEDQFTRKGIADFFGNTYTVTGDSDRMGYRLEGKEIEHESSADIISDGIVKGAVQIPGHGNPIIMLSDCQTTGGYTKIAHVISSDLWKIAQLKSGDRIQFKAVDIDEAHEVLNERMANYAEIQATFDRYRLEGYRALADKFK